MKHQYPQVSIGELVSRVDTWNPQRAGENVQFEYIDIASIDRDAKAITQTARITAHDAPSRARQLVKAGDVLVSTVRPNLNAVAVVPDSLDGATASTGFCVLRCLPNRLDCRYLYHWVRTGMFVGEMVRLSTGANYPAVTDRIVKESSIALPPLREQMRIAAILDKADAIRRNRQNSIRLCGAFRRSLFLDFFGDPSMNPNEFRTATLGDICRGDLRNGVSPSKKGSIRGKVLVLSAITGAAFDSSAVKEGTFDNPFKSDQLVCKGDFLVCRGNGNLTLCGTGRFADRSFSDAVFPDTMIAARTDTTQVSPGYLEEVWSTRHVRGQIEQSARTTSGIHKVNQKTLSQVSFPLPPPKLQNEFDRITQKAAEVQQQFQNTSPDDLFNSLVQRAFRGEL